MNGSAAPGPTQVRHDASLVQAGGNLAFDFPGVDELPVDPLNGLEFLLRARNENYAIGLQALVLAELKNALGHVILIDPHPAEPVAGHAALPIPEFDKPALTRKDLR